MRKLLSIFVAVLLCGILTACFSDTGKGMTDNVEINISASEKFSTDEIEAAINCVTVKFSDFNGCELTQLWYDENSSNLVIASYITHGRGSVNGVEASDIMVLFSNFNVDSRGRNGSLEPNSTYTDWNWILIRENAESRWEIDDWGN